MKKLIINLLFFMFTASLFANKPLIVTSVFPVKDLVSRVTKDRADVKFVIPVGANPHTFEPTPLQAKIIENADIFIGVSRQFDGWIEKYLNKNAKVFYIMKGSKNPHIWLSFSTACGVVYSTYHFLSKIDPKNKEFYHKNYLNYAKEIQETRIKYFKKFLKLKEVPVIQYHPAWEYLARDLNLRIIATIYPTNNKIVSIKTLTTILKLAQKVKARGILCSLNTKDKVIDVYLNEVKGLKKIELDPIGDPDSKDRNSFLKLMEFNCERIYRALSQ